MYTTHFYDGYNSPPPTFIGFVTMFLWGTRDSPIQVAVQWHGEQTPALPTAPSYTAKLICISLRYYQFSGTKDLISSLL